MDMIGNGIMKVEGLLRAVKGGEYRKMGEIKRMSMHAEKGNQKVNLSDDIANENIIVSIGVETDDGRRVTTDFNLPTSAWDLTNELVTVLEYLNLEPEELHRLDMHKEKIRDDDGEVTGYKLFKLPITFDSEEKQYILDFERMRTELIDDG